MRIMTCASLVLLASTGALAADEHAPFFFSPVPRWQMGADQEPETGEVCAAIKKECPGIKDVTDIHAEFGYDLLYDADGMLVGLRMTKSTGCKPLDESLMLGQRKFKMDFHKPGEPDIDDGIHVELPAGQARDALRIVRPDSTNVGMGCNPD